MATAIVKGALDSGFLFPDQILISDVSEAQLARFSDFGVITTTDNKYLSSACETLLFAVKPQSAAEIFSEIKDTITAQTVISIMAGVKLSSISKVLGQRNYVRVMPNTPALIGKGVSAVAAPSGDYGIAKRLFSALGEVVEIDEEYFDAVTSVSGSGPAYVYLFLKAMIDGGVEGGLPYEVSQKLTVCTAIGAAHMLALSDKPLDALIDAVCSKGGTTIEAIESFKKDGLEKIVKTGIAKCRARSKELSGNR